MSVLVVQILMAWCALSLTLSACWAGYRALVARHSLDEFEVPLDWTPREPVGR